MKRVFVPNTPKSAFPKPRAGCARLLAFLLALLWQPPGPEAQFAPRPQIRPPSASPQESREGLEFLRNPDAAIAITADELREDRGRQRIVGRGFAEIRYLGSGIQADHIEVQTATRDGVAHGNIVFQTGSDRIVADRAEFNLDTERMVVFNARGFIGATYYVTGRVIRRLSEDRYEIQGGAFTTCEGDLPDWAFGFERATFQVEGYARLQAPAVKIKGATAALLPWAMLPVKTKRATGFLLPGIGSGGESGVQFSPSFFWAINEWSDATAGFDYYSRRGTRYKGEYRYELSRDSSGEMAGRYLKDRRERGAFWDVRGSHRTRFREANADFHAALDLEKRATSDRTLESDLLARTRQDTDTRVNFTRNFPRVAGRLQAGMRRREGLNENEGQLFQKAPEITLDIQNKRLGTSDFYFSMDSSAVNFTKTEDENTLRLSRLHVEPSLSLRLETVPWLGVTPEIGFRETYWTHQKKDAGVGANPNSAQQVESGLSREMWFARIHAVGPRFSRIYGAEVGPFRDFKHVASLETTYRYSPAHDARDRRLIIPLDAVDALQDENVIEYALVNRMLTKLVKEEGTETRQLLRYRISQTFDLAEERRKQELDARPRRPFSDIAFSLEARPLPGVRLLQQTKYGPYDSKINEHSTGFLLDGGKNWYLNIDRTWTRRRSRFPESAGSSFFNFAGGFSISQRLFIEYITRLNKTEDATLEQSVIARYRACCWGLELTVTDTRDKSEIFLGFSLIGLLEGERAPRFSSRRNPSREGRFFGSGSLAPLPFEN